MGVETVDTTRPTEIIGLKGIEKLDTIPALKSGSFRDFLNKVIEIRKNPTKEKEIHDEIKKIDEDKKLSSTNKKTQLRGIDRVKLLAAIGKKIEFGEKSMEITLDFGDLTFAEKRAIGAGDILPPSVKKAAFGKEQSAEMTTGTRSIGAHGREYRSENKKYLASHTNTKLTIAYEDIMTTSPEQAQRMETTEEKAGGKAQAAVETAKKSTKDLRGEIGKPPVAPAKAAEKIEVGVSHHPVFIGDSQMEGMGNYYLRSQGIDAIDLRSMKMESIARTLENPSKVDNFYKRESASFIESRKNHVLNGREKLKTADAIMLQCGGNNVEAGQSLEKMQSSLEKLIATVRTFNTSAPIYIGTLMVQPKTSDESIRNQYNAWLLEQAAKGAFRIVDTNSIVKESGIKRPAGAHLDRNNYINLAKQALKAINYQKV